MLDIYGRLTWYSTSSAIQFPMPAIKLCKDLQNKKIKINKHTQWSNNHLKKKTLACGTR